MGAAAVVGNFERMTRIADSTGIPLDTPVTTMTQDIGSELGLDEFDSARNTPPLGAVAAFLGRVLRPVAFRIFRLLGFRKPKPDRNRPSASARGGDTRAVAAPFAVCGGAPSVAHLADQEPIGNRHADWLTRSSDWFGKQGFG